MEFDELVKGFCEMAAIADFALPHDGVCQLEIDGMDVNLVEVPETRQLLTWAEVGEPPAEGRERFYRVLLESMHGGRASGGSTFSINPESGCIWLSRIDQLQLLEHDTFRRMLEKFVNMLEEWRKIVVDYREVAGKPGTAAEGGRVDALKLARSGFFRV